MLHKAFTFFALLCQLNPQDTELNVVISRWRNEQKHKEDGRPGCHSQDSYTCMFSCALILFCQNNNHKMLIFIYEEHFNLIATLLLCSCIVAMVVLFIYLFWACFPGFFFNICDETEYLGF